MEIFASQGAPRVSMSLSVNFATSTVFVVDTGGKFATSVNETGSKFSAGVNDTSGKLPPVSTTPAENLSPVSTTPVANNGNNIRLLTPESELDENNLSICLLPMVSKQSNKNFSYFLLKMFSICHRCQRHRWCTLSCEYLHKFSKYWKLP